MDEPMIVEIKYSDDKSVFLRLNGRFHLLDGYLDVSDIKSLLTGFMKPSRQEEIISWECIHCRSVIYEKPSQCLQCGRDTYTQRTVKKRVNSGVVVLFDEEAFDKKPIYPSQIEKEIFHLEMDPHIWNSDGFRQIYEFCKEHHIRMLSLQAYQDGREEEL